MASLPDPDAKGLWVARVLGITLSATAQGSGAADAALAIREGTVAFAKMQLRWRDAQTRVRGELSRLAVAVLRHPGVQADRRFSQVKAVAAGLPKLVPDFGNQFEDTLNDAINAGGISAPIAKNGLAALDAYRQALAQAPALRELEPFAGTYFKLDMKLFADLDQTLASLQAEFERSSAAATGG